jgi:hypothetical protein
MSVIRMKKYYCSSCNGELLYKFNLVCHVCHPALAETCKATEEHLDRQLVTHLAELKSKMREIKRRQKGNKE